MSLSLSARVAIGLATQMAVFAAATGYLVFAADTLFDRLSLLKDELEPAAEDLRTIVYELKDVEAGLSARPGYERALDALRRLRLFDRIQQDAAALERAGATDRIADEARRAIAKTIEDLRDVRDGNRLVARVIQNRTLGGLAPRTNLDLVQALMDRMGVAMAAGRPEEVLVLARELTHAVRFVRATLQRTGHEVLAAMRDMNLDLYQRRSEISYAVVAVPAAALLIAAVVFLLTLRALIPVRRLSRAVRRLQQGEHEGLDPTRFAGELRDLAEALSALGNTLRSRGAALEQKKDELMRAERLAVVGRMASVVAHEVRNPLNSIGLNLDLLREMLQTGAPAGDPKVADLLQAIQREVDRLVEITEEYLKFGRLPRGVLSACDVVRVVREIRLFMDEEFSRNGIEVTLGLPQQPVMVLADESQLRQALVNVLRNSVEAMPQGGRLQIEVAEQADRVLLSVQDSGPGIPTEFRSRLFEPFATTKPRGTGLGLAFVQQVMHECGGEVSIESEVGRGTCVRFRLCKAGSGTARTEEHAGR